MRQAAAIVDSYLVGIDAALAVLQNHFLSASRASPTEPIKGWTLDNEHRRRGTIPGVGDYLFHGYGCRIEFEEGSLIDFDWNAGGDVVFDAWRVKSYADSVDDTGLDLDQFREVLELRVQSGDLVSEREGWFKQPHPAP
ncbi:MAG: hypothetical protein GY788_23040 [bacterium]|nr:hypothetical protein [bacterium]